MSILHKKRKHLEKRKKTNERILNMKMSTKGSPVFAFSLPGDVACSLAPPSVTLLIVHLRDWKFVHTL